MGISLTDLTDEDEPVQMTMFREQEQMKHERGQEPREISDPELEELLAGHTTEPIDIKWRPIRKDTVISIIALIVMIILIAVGMSKVNKAN